jgi:hypothetical protein
MSGFDHVVLVLPAVTVLRAEEGLQSARKGAAENLL